MKYGNDPRMFRIRRMWFERGFWTQLGRLAANRLVKGLLG